MAKISAANTTSRNLPSVCTCLNVRRASRAITRIYDDALAGVGLKVTQFSVLANVMHAGPLSVTKLARILKLDRTTLVRNLKALEASTFIANAESSDPRERTIAITEAGRKVVDRAMPRWQIAQKQIEAHLGEENVKLLGVLATSLESFSVDLDSADVSSAG